MCSLTFIISKTYFYNKKVYIRKLVFSPECCSNCLSNVVPLPGMEHLLWNFFILFLLNKNQERKSSCVEVVVYSTNRELQQSTHPQPLAYVLYMIIPYGCLLHPPTKFSSHSPMQKTI